MPGLHTGEDSLEVVEVDRPAADLELLPQIQNDVVGRLSSN